MPADDQVTLLIKYSDNGIEFDIDKNLSPNRIGGLLFLLQSKHICEAFSKYLIELYKDDSRLAKIVETYNQCMFLDQIEEENATDWIKPYISNHTLEEIDTEDNYIETEDEEDD